MTPQEIQQFISHSQNPCISIILPVHAKGADRRIDEQVLRKASQAARELIRLEAMKHSFDYHALIKELDDIVKSVDLLHVKQGLGIYLSPQLTKIVHFPFSVPHRIRVEQHFAKLELYYYLYAVKPYLALTVGQEDIHLYTGEEEQLTELRNDDFPVYYEEEYEYAKPDRIFSHGSTVTKQYERDTSALRAIRRMDFFRKADKKLKQYIDPKIPLVISGTNQEVNDFLQYSVNGQYVSAVLKGNYTFKDTFSLGKKCWSELNTALIAETREKIGKIPELFGKALVCYGFDQVWKHAKSGNAMELIIDRNYPFHVFITNDGSRVMLLRNPREKNVHLMQDPTERIIDLVIKKGGSITFSPAHEMNEYGGLALLLRFPG